MRRRALPPLLVLALAAGLDSALAFTNPSPACASAARRPTYAATATAAASLSVSMADGDGEYDINDDDDDNDGDGSVSGSVGEGDKSELALLLPGQTLRIRVGDVSLGRKAWKKRRRNSSPILVPCSVLGMNREWMVRWNVVTLLHAVGEESDAAGGSVAATSGKIGREYRRRLDGDLRDHAEALGHDSVESLLKALFDERIQAEYGIRTLIEPQHGNLVLATTLTRRQARGASSSAGMVQFRPDASPRDDEWNDKMMHTGVASVRLSSSVGKRPQFSSEPLGAALRVSADDEAAELYREGDEFNAFVYSYDLQGDNESPLLVLSADDPRGRKGAAAHHGGAGTSGTSTRVFKRKNAKQLVEDASVERGLGELTAGDGPFDATVVAVSSHSGAAFVDCGVGRKRGKRHGGGTARVLGMLRFEDMDRGASSEGGDSNVEAGDEVQVYVKAVSTQSGRFMVSLDPSAGEKKPKDAKREKQADKRKERLEKRISREDIESLMGNIYDGIVKAKSKTGDFYYVQPCGDGGDGWEERLPAGVASFEDGEEGGAERGSYSAGDHVRVRLEGVDEGRGQLALTLLD